MHGFPRNFSRITHTTRSGLVARIVYIVDCVFGFVIFFLLLLCTLADWIIQVYIYFPSELWEVNMFVCTTGCRAKYNKMLIIIIITFARLSTMYIICGEWYTQHMLSHQTIYLYSMGNVQTDG